MSMPLRATTVPAAVADALQQAIGRGEFQPGDRLPGHRELSAQYQVSLGSVREAVSALVSAGILETRAGSGTFVSASVPPSPRRPPGSNPATAGAPPPKRRLLDRATIEEMLEAREVLESNLVVLAARRCTPEDIARLRAAVTRMEAGVDDPAAYSAADIEFHLSLAEAARNRVLLRAMTDIRGLLQREMELSAEVGARRHGNLEFSVAAHRAIVDALAAHDEARARAILEETMQRHHGFVLSMYPPHPAPETTSTFAPLAMPEATDGLG